MTAVSRLTSLEALELQCLRLTEKSPSYLNRLSKLKSLTPNECQIELEILDQLMPVARAKSLAFNDGPKISPQLNVIARNRHLTLPLILLSC